MAELKAVSLFSGGGGLDIGMELAGFTPVWATDFDAHCIQTLKDNKSRLLPISVAEKRTFLQHARIMQCDIRVVDFRQWRAEEGLEIDCVFGGPPCQAFSSAGRMGSVHDPRGQLVFEFARAIAELQPRAFVMENVRGLVTARDADGTPGGVIHSLLETYQKLGYSTHAFLLNAADFGAYQRRVRCFVVGLLGSLTPPIPEATHSSSPNLDLFSKLPWRTLGEFLSEHADLDESQWVRPTSSLAEQLASVPSGSGLKSAGVVETTRPGGHWGYRQGTFIADPSLPARTVTGSSTQDWIRLDDGTLRRLTEREVQLLQGFPEQWVFTGPKARRFLQIGNAVPVPLARAVGEMVAEALRRDSDQAATSPSPWLLHRDLHTAIAYTRKEELRNGASRRARKPAHIPAAKSRGSS